MKKTLLTCFICILSIWQVFAQDRTVSGKVTDDAGVPLPGVNISVKGTTKGTATNADGEYSINVPNNSVLLFSFIGYFSQEIAVGNQSSITIKLLPNSNELNEVVITTSFGLKRQEKEIGYAATIIDNRELTQAKAVNFAQSLNGKVSGVNISTSNSGVFENSKVIIRGIRSLTGNNTPMYILDGSQVPSSFISNIPPGDIEETTILKSASSAALYGPDAVNGVIVITTKKGASNKKPVISFNSTYQATKVAFYPKLQHDFGPGAGEVLDQYGNYGYVPYENQIYGPKFDGSTQNIGIKLEDGSIQSGPYSNLHKKDKINFYNTGSTFQNSISIRGADYYISVMDANIKGLMPDDVNRRTALRFNGNKNVNKFSIDYNIGYTLQNSNVVWEPGLQNLFSGQYSGSIFFSVLQTGDNVPLLNYKDWRNDKFSQYSNYYNEFAINPYWIIGNLRSANKTNSFYGNTALSYDVMPWLKATARFSTSLSNSRTDNTQAPLQVSDWAIANRNSTQYFNGKGNLFNSSAYSSFFNVDYYINGKTKIGDAFSFSYVLGGNYRDIYAKDISIQSNNLVIPYLYNTSARSGDATIPDFNSGGNFMIRQKRVSAFGTFQFGFKDFVFVEFTGRNDADSRIAKQNRSIFYPGGNISLVLSDAIPSIKNTFVSFLKLRAAYTKSANVNISPYALAATYSQPLGFPYGSNVGYTANNSVTDPNLKPERVTSQEVGLELGLFNNKFDFEATYFNQRGDDQIISSNTSSTTGYTGATSNSGSFKNYGVEMALGVAPYQIGKAKISVKMNATYNDNKVLSTPGNIPIITGGNSGFIQIARSSPTVNNVAAVGGPAFQFQLTDYLRDPATGKVIVDAATGNPSQDPNLVIKGRSLPLWVLGITPRLSIGGFSFSMTWDYKGGHQFYSGLGSDMDFSGISARSAAYDRQRFVFPNSVYKGPDGSYVENKNIQIQDGNYGFWTGSGTNTGIGTNYFASAAALRLREVNIGYTLPENVFGQKVFKEISISLVARNLLLFVPKSNQWGDPEFNYNSSSNSNTFGLASAYQTPASRLFGASLDLTF